MPAWFTSKLMFNTNAMDTSLSAKDLLQPELLEEDGHDAAGCRCCANREHYEHCG